MPTLNRNIVISLVLALAAAAALFVYTSHVRTSAETNSSTVSVIVASHEIPAGTTVDDANSKGWLELPAVRQSRRGGRRRDRLRHRGAARSSPRPCTTATS